ncbi:MAG TPA: UTP--glucose-1-phosphate uridylyltransferase [Phycisphaerales bacterium]|nr:UTP--glucose-1-phosphate uridylyltransferase [Phycisphaerales bacterium]
MTTPATSTSTRFAAARAKLIQAGQEHVLRFYDELPSEAQRTALLDQIDGLDLASLENLAAEYVFKKPTVHLPPEVQPAPYYPVDPGAQGKGSALRYDRAAAKAKGQSLLKAGKVAAFVVAGGQGSRLGYDGPKGCYPAGAVTDAPLFAIFAQGLLGAQDRYGHEVPWYVMTSPLNHRQTVEFFEAHRFFGLKASNVRFFQQGVLPSLDMQTGRLMLAEKGVIATNPDGHGGSLKALHHSGAIADMKSRGVEIVSYFQVDNPLVNILDPIFIGLHAGAGGAASSAQMSSKMVAKRDAAEKVGVFCAHGAGPRAGRVEVIEYSDMPPALSQERLPDGSLRFCAGSIAVHAIGVHFIEQLNTDPHFRLPLHRAEKKIPCIDPRSGAPISPAANNGVKLEAFVFDALPMCERSVVMETLRTEEFAPIKNADGADSPASCREIQTARAAAWLELAGVAVPRDASGRADCVLEISPRSATTADELAESAASGRIRLPKAVERGQRLAL